MGKGRFVRGPLELVAIAILGLIAIAALIGPLAWPRDPVEQDLANRLQEPSSAYLLGTDQLGRDMVARILSGARLSLIVAIAVAGLASVSGTFVGLIAGYVGGLADEALMRVTDVFLAFPSLILAMAIAGALGPSLVNAIVAIAVVSWPVYARLVRAQLLSLRRLDFVEAARSIGARDARIVFRHLLPNALGPVLVQASFDMGAAIIAVAGLSFIGFGAQPPTPEWGVMISEGRNFFTTQPWLTIVPGVAMLLAAGSFNVLGDALRDAFDPRRAL